MNIDLEANNRPEEEHIMPQSRKLWLDTSGLPVITTTPNGERNAARWGWTPAAAVALLASVPQWQPIKKDRIKVGMRIRVTTALSDCVTTRVGVVHHTDRHGNWYTKDHWMLGQWVNPTTYEVDSSTIPDPDAELIEKLAGLLDLTDREDAREVIAAVRAHDEAVTGDE